MGAEIEGIGTDRLHVVGRRSLGGAAHDIVPDRIEAGTYACAAAITGGSVLLEGARAEHLGSVARTLREAGVAVEPEGEGLRVSRLNGLHGVDVMTEPFPGFATDMQAQFMALMAVAEGASMITETIFENRSCTCRAQRMGARIKQWRLRHSPRRPDCWARADGDVDHCGPSVPHPRGWGGCGDVWSSNHS
jgi:UDP-N-acetylglucosamine 1-carboxyvinyltransferase